MSDQTPHDEWLTSDSWDSEGTRRADELEIFLAAALAGAQARDVSRLNDMTQLDSRVSNERMVNMLAELGEEIMPDADFAADLQAQIERRIREHGSGGPDGTDAAAAHGSTGRVGGNGGEGGAEHGRALGLRRNPQRYRPLWAAMAALVLLAFLLALPPVQASLRRPLCLGSVCIVWNGSPHPTPGQEVSPASTPLPSVLGLAGRTTLALAQAQTTFPIRLPTYPADLGRPDDVFLQNLDGAAVVLAWADHANPDRVRLSLSELSSGIYVYKFTSQPIAVTKVHGQQAFWTTGPYMVQLQDGTYDMRRLVTGHALIWTEGDITYRLETSVSLDEAVRIAESLR